MGKIFDALEKADRTKTGAARPKPIARARKRPGFGKGADKVVPLMNSKREVGINQIDKKIITYHDPQSIEAEMFKALRTNIFFPANGEPAPRTILVTSALPDDGKSFIATNLAVSIAQGVEEYVLLMDGDVRKPNIHTQFGFRNVAGLSEYLAKDDSIGNLLLKTPIEKLTLLPAGNPPANPTELMSSKKMRTLMEEVKTRYDDRYIVIDTPPPSMASETNAIIKFVDKVIFVVRAGKTPQAAIADTIEKIGKEKILGIVFNQADQTATKYYGYSKSYY